MSKDASERYSISWSRSFSQIRPGHIIIIFTEIRKASIKWEISLRLPPSQPTLRRRCSCLEAEGAVHWSFRCVFLGGGRQGTFTHPIPGIFLPLSRFHIILLQFNFRWRFALPPSPLGNFPKKKSLSWHRSQKAPTASPRIYFCCSPWNSHWEWLWHSHTDTATDTEECTRRTNSVVRTAVHGI